MKLVGLGGYPRSGKSAAAEAFVKLGWTAAGFSDAICEIALELIPDLDHDRDRSILQRLGHTARRAIHPDVWIWAVERTIDQAPGPVVVSGVRFPNEVDLIHRRGGMFVKVRRPGCGPGRTNLHEMETSLDDVVPDRWLDNNRDLEWLAAQVKVLADIA